MCHFTHSNSTNTNNNKASTLMSLIHFLWRVEFSLLYRPWKSLGDPSQYVFFFFYLDFNPTLLFPSLSTTPPTPSLSIKGWWTIDGSNSFYGNSIWVISLETYIKTFHLQTSSVQLGRPLFPWMYQHGGASSPGPWPLQFPLAPDAHGTLGIELDSGKGGGRWDLECFFSA